MELIIEIINEEAEELNIQPNEKITLQTEFEQIKILYPKHSAFFTNK